MSPELVPYTSEKKQKSIFLFAGEQSGDAIGGKLVEALKQSEPTIELWGVGGMQMEQAGLRSFLDISHFHVMGFSDVIKALPRLYKQFHKIKNEILSVQPEACIFIDYPDFNMKMASALRKSGFRGKLIHYVCPSVWAWRKNRVNHLAKTLDRLLTVLPFEQKYFKDTSLQVTYVGHPLASAIECHVYNENWKEQCKIFSNLNFGLSSSESEKFAPQILDFSGEVNGQRPFTSQKSTKDASKLPEFEEEKSKIQVKPILALFPGSRKGEIHRNLPLQLKALQEFKNDYTFAISCARKELEEDIVVYAQDCVLVPHEFRYELMRDAFAAIATSGTVILELGLHATPTVATYQLSNLNYFLGRYIFRIMLPFYTLVNIISEKEVFPEFIHRKLSSVQIAKRFSQLLKNRENCVADCKKMRDLLKKQSASEIAAKAIMEVLNEMSLS